MGSMGMAGRIIFWNLILPKLLLFGHKMTICDMMIIRNPVLD